MDFGVAASRYRAGTRGPRDDEVRCSDVPRANTASLSGHGSEKPGEQELHLQISHRPTETTVRSGAEWHEGQVRPCRHDVLVTEPHPVVRCGFAERLQAERIRRGDRHR